MPSRAPTSKVLCRIETDPLAIFRFLQLNGYPRFWSPEQFQDGVLAVRVMDLAQNTLGYIWGRWVETGRFGFHVCAAKGTSLPFLGSDLLSQLYQMGFWIGADEIVTNVDGHPDQRAIHRLLRRAGFAPVPRTDGGSDYALNLWTLINDERTSEKGRAEGPGLRTPE